VDQERSALARADLTQDRRKRESHLNLPSKEEVETRNETAATSRIAADLNKPRLIWYLAHEQGSSVIANASRKSTRFKRHRPG
jgi:hypothetical protein